MTITRWFWFAMQLMMILVISVSVWPVLPWWLAPALVPLVVIASAISGDVATSARWAIWGGLAVALLSPSSLGVRWLSILLVGLTARESRRLVAIRDLPWLWPIWFGTGTFLATLPIALLTHQVSMSTRISVTTAVWGSLALGLWLWFANQPRGHR